MANFTLDLFGETVNVGEVETRIEGMEYLIESIFGPGGPISASTVNSHVDRALRYFRSTVDEAKESGIFNESPVIDNNFKVPKVSCYILVS